MSTLTCMSHGDAVTACQLRLCCQALCLVATACRSLDPPYACFVRAQHLKGFGCRRQQLCVRLRVFKARFFSLLHS